MFIQRDYTIILKPEEYNYKYALKLALEKLWVLEECNQGEKCWCRIIRPEPRIFYGVDEIIICPSGTVNSEHAQHIVELHNRSLIIAPKSIGVVVE